MPCSNAAKTRNTLKFAGVPLTTGPISAASGPKFTILWEHAEEILLRLGEERKREERKKNKRQDENIYGLPYYIGRPTN